MILKGSKQYYEKEVVEGLRNKFKFKSIMEVPKLDKIVLNMGLSEAKNNKKVISENVKFLSLIAGQKSVATLARKSVAGFKIREKMPIGAKVTLRKNRMYDFLVRFINLNLPRVKDFHGLGKKSFDHFGNYTIGLKDVGSFIEVSHLHSQEISGVSAVFVTSKDSKEEAFEMLKLMGFPFRD